MVSSTWAGRRSTVLLGLILGLTSPALADPPDSTYRLAFADEFNGTSVDTSKWVVASPSWTMPNSASTASASQVSVGSGVLTLGATRPGTAASFTSGSITGYGVYNFAGGYVEARIKLPTTPGSWPAFWGLYNNWPPEADIMEYPMQTASGTSTLSNASYNTNFHYTDSSGNAAAGAGPVTTSASLAGTWHTFGMDWTAGTSVNFYLDGTQVSYYTGSAVAQMVSMYLLLDYAVGGSWPGTPSTTTWPVGASDQTLVDWVRVWQKNSSGDTASTWKINGGGAFATTGNWSNGIVPKYGNQTAVFGTVGTAATAAITLPPWTVFGGLTFNGGTTTPAYTIGSSSTAIQLAGQPLGSSTTGATVLASSTSTANQAINAKVELWSATTFENDMTGGQTLSFNSEVSGAGTLSVSGVGATVLNASNTYTGGTYLGTSAGSAVVRATASGALGTGSVLFDTAGNTSPARLEVAGGVTLGNAISFTGRNNASAGIENISGNNTLNGVITLGTGGGSYYVQSDAGQLTLAGSITPPASGTRTLILQGAGNGAVSGNINYTTGNTLALTMAGTGTWMLTGANTYTGTTTVSAGTLRLAPAPVAAYSFDNVSGSTVMNTGSGGTAMNGTLTNGAAVVSGGRFGNAVSLSSGAYVNIPSPIVDLGNTGNWTVSAWVKTTTAGATLLSKGSGTSWTNGNTVFYLGDGAAGGSGGIPSSVRYAGGFFQGSASATSVNNGGWHMVTYANNGGTCAIYVDGVSQGLSIGNSGFSNADVGTVVRLGFTPDPNTGDGTVNYNGLLDEVQFYSQALSAAQITALYQGQISAGSLPSAASVTIASAGTLDVNGVSQTIGTLTGTGTLTKTGTGTLTLSNASAFTGTTSLSGGILVVNGSLSGGGSGTLAIAAGTVLTGSGTVSAPTTINGTHQPGASPGTQTFNAMTYGSTARLAWELMGNSATSGFDKVVATGTVAISSGAVVDVYLNDTGSTVDLSNTFWTQAHSWPVVTAGSLSGGAFALGNVTADLSGRSVSNYGTLALQQSGTTVTLVFTPYTAQQNWLRQYFGTNWNNPAIAGNTADPDNDGVSNLVEWALGLNPTKSDAVPWTSGTPGLPVETVAAVGGQNYLALQVRRPIGLTGITYGVQVSSDLVSWSVGVQEGSATANGDGSETVLFRDTIPVGQGNQRFIRLVITQ